MHYEKGPMTTLRTIGLWAVLTLLLVVLAAGLYSGYRWQQFKDQQGIEAFEIDGLRLSSDGVTLRQLVLHRLSDYDEKLAVRAEDVVLSFDSWRPPLTLRFIGVQHLNVDWQPSEKTNDVDSPDAPKLPSRQDIEAWARWLPRKGSIASFNLTVPCAKGTCREQGQARWQHAGSQALPAELDVTLVRNRHRLALLANAFEQAADTHVDLELQLDDKRRLTLQNQLTPKHGHTLWRGTLAMNELPEAPWLLEWLSDWMTYTPPALPELPEQMRIGAGWALEIDTDTVLDDGQALGGELRVSANLPAPWPVVGIGQLQGQLDLSARVDQGVWLPTELRADIAAQPIADLLMQLPVNLRPSAVSLKITPAPAGVPTQALPLSVQLAASGPSPLTLDARLLLETAAPFALTFENTRLKLRSQALAGSDVELKGIEADLRLSGRVSQDAAAIRLGKNSTVTVNSLTAAGDLNVSKLLMTLAGMSIDAGFGSGALQPLAVNGTTTVTAGELEHPALRPQGWRWNGKLLANDTRVSLEGPLVNDAGLSLPLALTHNRTTSATRLDLTLPEVFLRAGNPLAATLADWPQVLELNNGRIQGQAQLTLPDSGPLAATATFSARGLGGIYDRTELSGLDAELSAAVQNDQLTLDLSELTLREVNPGFTFGPLRFVGGFTGPLDNLAQGRLGWTVAEARLLGGRLWLDPGAADLAASTQQLTARLRGLQLPLLLEAYPAEGLSGTGVIDGEMQVQRSAAGISVEQGSLKAREPGGALQFRSAKIQALGQANPAMRLVTEALDDFHYDLLASDVRYAADGTLDLGLKLHGRNPALEGGRPINFSINLEEDIPALLTSLQLSDRVSETIQRRVQERLRSDR
jgi:hypothetical protein